MNQKSVLVLTGALVVIAIAVFVYTQYVVPNQPAPSEVRVTDVDTRPKPLPTPVPTPRPTPAPGPATDVEHAVSVESYVKKHISEFSPVKEQLGGKFYVSKVDAYDGKGIVSYEDGHNAYTADFMYTIDDFGTISVHHFVVRP